MTLEPQDDRWHELAYQYCAHHMSCPACIAAGRGARYGVRCIEGEPLWREYADCAGTWTARDARRDLQSEAQP